MTSLNTIAPGVWSVDHHFSATGLEIPLRMTVLQAEDGGLVLYSPVPLAGDLPDRIRELGEVQHIVGPNRYHHLHIAPTQELFPHARLWGARGLREKRSDLKGMVELPAESPWPGIDLVHIEGAPFLNEVCLYHRGGDTTLVCDLVFNMSTVGGWFGVLFTKMTGTYQKLAQSRTWHLFARDKVACVASIQKVLGFEAERVLMGHGDALTEQGTAQMAEVMILR